MLARIISSTLVATFNGLSWLGSSLAGRRRKKAEAAQRPDSRSTFAIGRQIIGAADVSASPALGDWVRLPFAEMLMHCYAIGRTGCGKTSLLTVLVDAFARQGKTFVIIDARGDLINRLLARLAAIGGADHWRDRLTIIDLPSQWSIPFNPFAMPGDPYGIASAIFDSLEERVSGGFGVQVSECLRSCLVTLALGRGKWTMLHIEPLLGNPAFRKSVLNECADEMALAFWDRYARLSPDQQANWTGAVLNKILPLLMAVPQLRRMIGQKGCLPFRKLIDRPGHVIFVNLGISELHGPANAIGSMIATAIIRAAMSRVLDTAEGERNPVFMLCDEFENYSNPLFHEAVQEGRRAGLGLALFHQSLSQIKTATADLILNNAKTMFLFATGARDASQLSREIGGEEAWDARTVLTRQAAGQAYLLRRGEEPRRVKIDYAPDPKVPPSAISAIREASNASFARPAAEVDAEIAADLASIRAMVEPSADTEQSRQPKAPVGRDGSGVMLKGAAQPTTPPSQTVPQPTEDTNPGIEVRPVATETPTDKPRRKGKSK